MKQIQDSVDSTSAIHLSCVNHVSQLLDNVVNSLPREMLDSNNHIISLKTYLDKSRNCYLDLDTEYRRRKHLVSEGLVLPEGWKIGTRVDVAANGKSKVVDVYAQYVSIIETLTHIQKNEKLENKSTYPYMSSFEDMPAYKTSEYYAAHPDAFRLTFYLDDIECGNALGSRSGVNKMTMCYMSIDNSGQVKQSHGKLTSIHLVLVCHASDITTYGFQKILQPLVTDLRKLDSGVQIIDPNGKHRIMHARLEHLVGDNLAANQLLGLVESFSKTHFCRFCYISGHDSIVTTTSMEAPVRTAYTHTIDVETASHHPEHYKVSGVKGRCAFDELSYFSGIESTVPDLM